MIYLKGKQTLGLPSPLPSWIHSENDHRSQERAEPKPEIGNSVQVSPWVAGTQMSKPPAAAHRVCTSRKLESETKLRLKTQAPPEGMQLSHVSCCTQCPPKQEVFNMLMFFFFPPLMREKMFFNIGLQALSFLVSSFHPITFACAQENV